MSIKSKNTLPEGHSDTTLKHIGSDLRNKEHKRSLQIKRPSTTPEPDLNTVTKSVGREIELEMVISLTSGSEYHKITEYFEHPISGPLAHMDIIKKFKPDLNLAVLKHIPTETSVHKIIQYHNFK